MRSLRRRLLAAVCLLALLSGTGAALAASDPDPEEKAMTPTTPLSPAQSIVAEMSTTEQAASILMGNIASTDPAALSSFMTEQQLGGFILMGSNIPADEVRLQELTSAVTLDTQRPPLIAIDQEGGPVSRLPWDDFAAAPTLKDQDPAATATAFAARSSLVALGGANVNFGIVADYTDDSSSFIFSRALGTSPDSAATRVAQAVTAEEEFVASTIKHFPGHGAAPGDSHSSIPYTDMTFAQWRSTEAMPFRSGIDAGASLVMFGHLSYRAVDTVPASLSPLWHEVIRDELGFDGVIVTDDMGMLLSSGRPEYADPVANAVSAVAAGNDLILLIAGYSPETVRATVDGIVAAVEAGTLPAERLQEAAERVMTLRLKIGENPPSWERCPDCTPAT